MLSEADMTKAEMKRLIEDELSKALDKLDKKFLTKKDV